MLGLTLLVVIGPGARYIRICILVSSTGACRIYTLKLRGAFHSWNHEP